MQLEEHALSFACGGAWLYGVLSMPAQPASRGVLIVVGGPQVRTGSHRQFTLLARSLAQAGIPAMRFDYRGMGDSEGAARNFEQVQEDLCAALDCFLTQAPGLRDVVLLGLCDGASAATLYAPGDLRVAGLVLLNPWARTESGAARATLKHYYRSRVLDAGLWKKIASGRFDVRQAMGSFVSLARTAFSRGTAAAPHETSAAPLPARMYAALRQFEGKVLVILSGADLTAQEFAGLASSSRDWAQLLAAKRVIRRTLPGADHTCSRREWHEQMVDWTVTWVRSA